MLTDDQRYEVEMAGAELQIVRLKNDFYRDGFYKILITLAMIVIAIVLLGVVSFYLYLAKPQPVIFSAGTEWRLLPDVPLDQPYLKVPDLLQWVSNVLPQSFNYDFINYKNQMIDRAQYYTDAGWKKFLDQVNQYVNNNAIQNFKQFINGTADAAPFILNQGMISGRYGWWIQMPIKVDTYGLNGLTSTLLVVQALVVRISTLNNLNGVAIDNVIVSKGEGEQVVRANQ